MHLLHSDMDWGRSIHVPAQYFFIFVHGHRLSQEPACRFIQPQLIQLQPFYIVLHGRRNLIELHLNNPLGL